MTQTELSRPTRARVQHRRGGPGGGIPRTGWVVLITAASGVSAWLVGRSLQAVAGDRNEPWIIGRASGVACYLLLVALVATGLVLSHPWRNRVRQPGSATRIRIHVSLAVFAVALLVLHVAVLATDHYAKVGWAGALLPMASTYRPLPITFGVIGAYAGLLAGLTAVLAGRWARRVWWPIHKVSSVTLVLVWVHSLFAGSDATGLRLLYASTAGLILLLAAWRYCARGPAVAGGHR